jgi:hypothetical protein
MRIAVLVIITAMISGCASTYKQTNLIEPTAKLLKGRSVVIATPANGSYENKEYSTSGRMTALAVRAAFARFTNTNTVSTDCKELECLKRNTSSNFDYYVIPEILHWEDRATEWSGIRDKIEIKLIIYEGQSWKELATTIISGKSKWATFGGDHPQDLLPEPLNKYVESLY